MENTTWQSFLHAFINEKGQVHIHLFLSVYTHIQVYTQWIQNGTLGSIALDCRDENKQLGFTLSLRSILKKLGYHTLRILVLPLLSE